MPANTMTPPPTPKGMCRLLTSVPTTVLRFYWPFHNYRNHISVVKCWSSREGGLLFVCMSQVFSGRRYYSSKGSSFHISKKLKNTSLTLDDNYNSPPPWLFNHKKIIVCPFYRGTPHNKCTAYCCGRECRSNRTHKQSHLDEIRFPCAVTGWKEYY